MSTKSPHYGLYQWEGSDPVSREEMNHNFAVLEENLHEKLVYAPLASYTVSQAAQLVSFDLSNVDWNKYHEVVVELWYDNVDRNSTTIYVNQDQSFPDDTYASVMVPPTNTTIMTSLLEGLGKIGGFRGSVRFFCNRHETSYISAECRSLGAGRCYNGWNSNLTFSQLNTLDLYCYNKVPVGVQVTVWGVE